MTSIGAQSGRVVQEGNAHTFFDRSSGRSIAKVLPGQFYVSNQDESIATVLGSCIAACVRDPVAGIGGLNHFMLPVGNEARADSWGEGSSAMNRFGNFAMEALINTVIKNGGLKSRLEVKLFGGARVLDIATDVGETNISFVEQYVLAEGLNVLSRDLGADYARKILFEPRSGRARMRRLRDSYVNYVAVKEKELMAESKRPPPAGELELF
ncbi:MAG: chemoreceptor glutamine deamidase CheD [Pseudomonadota bacterium]